MPPQLAPFNVLRTGVPALLLLLLTAACSTTAPRKFSLPARISEASGLVIDGDDFIWHNDSGDGPYLYTTDRTGKLLRTDTLNARASDYEDLAMDENGLLYVGDFGNNRGQREVETVYRYDRSTRRTDSITYTYPGQDAQGRLAPGNYDCEAMVVDQGKVHLFTKDMLFGPRQFYVKHYTVPATPGHYEAELVDSLYLPRRVVTGAALDRHTKELFLIAYNFRMLLGFLPSSSASLITLSDYPDERFLSGTVRRRNLSWAVPTQHEAVAVYDEDYLYIGAEATKLRRHAIGRRIRRR
ncbi:hypothetical protein LEM8419_00234 [Neolewinella maritima]|uniref:Uncharacterized protein n=1 Tax=Neolewinella maritima TaxID=1383882 RepID=A0ABM9AXI9_9BACT|nr:hypothetical protein [Neolewinella maritima]CAH0998939.1 hypothetical protein LEM8419_00234 [Neolewinella maritima]